MDGTVAKGRAIRLDALVHVEERTAVVPELEANSAGERRAGLEAQLRAEPRGERGRAVGDGVYVADATRGSEDGRVRSVRAEVIGTGGVK